ncbi:MAG: hypothetical protein JW738_00500 [Actinobacteria bacterium]|nr:hypothetical protein [Actinomycetota bacterium]
MRIRIKKSEEGPGDLESLEGQYFPENEYIEGAVPENPRKKYIPRHKGGRRRAQTPGEEELPPLVPEQAVPETEQVGAVPQMELRKPFQDAGPGDVAFPHAQGGMRGQAIEPGVKGEYLSGSPQEPPGAEKAGPARPPEGSPPEESIPPGYGYYWVPPGMYPPPYPPQAYGYGGGPPEMPPQPGIPYPFTGPGPYPSMPPPFADGGPYNGEGFPLMGADEEFRLDDLAVSEETHWRADLKWIFGIITGLFIFTTLLFTGYYRVSGAGAAGEIQSSLILNVTKIESIIDENYTELRSKARKDEDTVITIPDIGVDVEISAEDILSMDEAELTGAVVGEVQKTIYLQGYEGDLPMKYAQGPGEERARAVCVTYLGSLNKGAHENLFIPIIICLGLSIIFFVLFVVFCRGWGKAIGPGVLFICAALPGSLLLRLGGAFFWNPGSAGLYEGAMYQALIDTGSMTVLFFDIILGIGALLLLVGVVGGTIAGRRRRRITPFNELETPQDIVAGGPSVDPGCVYENLPREQE